MSFNVNPSNRSSCSCQQPTKISILKRVRTIVGFCMTLKPKRNGEEKLDSFTFLWLILIFTPFLLQNGWGFFLHEIFICCQNWNLFFSHPNDNLFQLSDFNRLRKQDDVEFWWLITNSKISQVKSSNTSETSIVINLFFLYIPPWSWHAIFGKEKKV